MPDDPDTTDPELEAAIGSFLDWAEDGGVDPELPPSSDEAPLAPGTTLGEFEPIRRLGSGGMGVVYLAHQRSIPGRRVALKLLRNRLGSRRLLERFRREVAAIGQLDHPGIVPIVAAGQDGETPYFAMKYLPGATLKDIVRELRWHAKRPRDAERVRSFVDRTAGQDASDSRVSDPWESGYIRWVAQVGLHIAEALQCAHEHSIVHRDVKPGNIMITLDGRPILLDFGLADDEEQETLTLDGDFLGTLAYASPEQLHARATDGRTDVYSLGATLYELLALKKPFEGRGRRELLERIQRDAPRPLDNQVPRDLRTIIHCALSANPDRRYESAAALAADLRSFLAGTPIAARPPGLGARAWAHIRNHPILSTAVAASAFAALGWAMRDHSRAEARVEAGTSLVRSLDRARTQYRADLTRLNALRRLPVRDLPAEQRLRTALRQSRSEAGDLYLEASSSLKTAFHHVANYEPARHQLADLIAAELRHALDGYEDLINPERISRLEQELQTFDSDLRHAELLDPLGPLQITCDPSGAQIEIRHGTELIASGPAPFSTQLPEGTYQVRLRAPGYGSVELPVLVRRRSSIEGPDAIPHHEVAVRLLPDDWIDPLFAYVPGGWTLVEEDPPHMVFVPDFLMQRHEVTNRQWIGWLNEYFPHGTRDHADLSTAPLYLIPRFGEAGPPLVGFEEDRGWFHLNGSTALDEPVRGLSRSEMDVYARHPTDVAAFQPVEWYPSLPSVAEWTRAARGVDARSFPWGSSFEDNACSHFQAGQQHEPSPVPVGSFPADRSPFGVLDLAGSLAEATLDSSGAVRGHFAFCGGSFQDWEAEQFHTSAVRLLPDQPHTWTGFRVVKRPLPAELTQSDLPVQPFRDDFERSASQTVGNGWFEVAGFPLIPNRDAKTVEQCSLEAGALVLVGGTGNFSAPSAAWHRIHMPPTGFVVRATLCASQISDPTSRRSFGISLASAFALPPPEEVPGTGSQRFAELGISFTGVPRMTFPGVEPITAPLQLNVSAPLSFEIRATPTTIEGRIWSSDSPRPDSPTIAARPGDSDWVPRYLGVRSASYVHARIACNEIEAIPMD